MYSFDFDGVDAAAPYERTLSVARQAHRFYGTLVREYDRHGYIARVNAITQRQLNRAANAVADLIAAPHDLRPRGAPWVMIPPRMPKSGVNLGLGEGRKGR